MLNLRSRWLIILILSAVSAAALAPWTGARLEAQLTVAPAVQARSAATPSLTASSPIPATAVGATVPGITSPRQALGFDIGDDYRLATYTQLETYWKTLAAESDRMTLEQIGRTAEDRPQWMAVITSPANHRHLARYREIARRLAKAEGVGEVEARALVREGKAVVWIDGGLHATEVLGAHQLMELVYQMVSRDDPETLRFLDDVILLAVQANPDGMELVSNWYMREPEPEKRSTAGIPRLYQKYVGHDNNRDFYMVTQPETRNMTRVMFREWFPQIVYNHHQTGPAGAVLFAPPFRDPFNYNLDPLVPLEIDAVGAAMHGRFVAEEKPGATMRRGASYSTWWNGGLRTAVYFHNMIGLLTETIGNPTPVEIPFVLERQLPSGALPDPIAPQKWHFRQSIDYSITADRAVLDYASRYREVLLYNIYRMGRNSIERGSRDHWTVHPKRIEAVRRAVAVDPEASQASSSSSRALRGARAVPSRFYEQVLHDPEARDPRGYILPADQPDFLTATKFVNALIKTGVEVERATKSFKVAGRDYPAGSYVVKTAQAFRPHVLDMFEPQDHPNDFQYPGGPPIPPYDNAGWTLAYQMGVRFDRILEGFEGPFERIRGLAEPPRGAVAHAADAVGFLFSHQVNDAFRAMNRLLAAGVPVYWLWEAVTVEGRRWPAGTMFIPAVPEAGSLVGQLAADVGLRFEGVHSAPAVRVLRMRPVRIALWDRYGGSMPSGWTRWLLERFEFPFQVVYPKTLDEADLRGRFDAIVFVNGAISPAGGPEGRRNVRSSRFGTPPDPETIPTEYRDRLGRITAEKTVPRLAAFLRDGGTIVTIGSSTDLAYYLGVPVRNYLVDAEGRPLPREKYYMPGSIHRVRVDNSRPVAWGLGDHVDVFFNNSPVFGLEEGPAAGLRRIAWFDTNRPLRSGWAWGQQYLAAGTAMVEAQVGEGRLYLFGPEILNRGQTHGTFKLLFNAVSLAGARSAELEAAAGR
ncbi:MAG: M14 metallopeptidase family protein [Gemmatimonadota bacterium]